MSDQLKSQGYYLLTILDEKGKDPRHVVIYGHPASYVLKNDVTLLFAMPIEAYQFNHFKDAGLAD